MNRKIIFSFLWVFLTMMAPILSTAQGIQLNKYKVAEGLTFTSKTGYQFNIRGYAQAFLESKNYSDTTYVTGLNHRYRMRRLRFRLTGSSASQKVDYRLQMDFSGTSETGDGTSDFLMDAWIAYNFNRRMKITFGQRSTPTDNRELYMGSHTLQLVERSRVTSSFSTIREFGLFFQGDIRFINGSYLRNYFTITNGDGLNVKTSDHGGLKYGARVDFLPFGLFTYFGQFRQVDMMRENSPKLVMGLTYSYNQGMSSRRGRNSGSILYLNELMEESLPDYTKMGFDFLFKYKGFSALGEFLYSRATVPGDIVWRVRNDGSTSSTFDVNGEQDVENYVKGRMMLGKGYNIQFGYIFKNLFSIDARYTHLDADTHSFLNNGTFYNRPNYYTLGISKYLAKNYGFKIQGSISYVELAKGSNDIFGNPINGHEWIGRLITSKAF